MEQAKRPILVPVDFSESTITTTEHAAILARTLRVDIVFLHVIETLFDGFSVADLTFDSSSKENNIVEEVERRMKLLVQKFEDQGSHCKYQIEIGSIHKTIVKVAEQLDAGSIVLGAHGQAGFEEFLIGSNSFRVTATAPCPVITLHDNRQFTSGYKTIVMPIDTSFYSRQKVKATALLAQAFDAKIHVLGVSIDDDTEAVRKVHVLCQQVSGYLNAHAINHDIFYETGGNITDKTILYAKALKANLISIMTEQEPSVRSLIMGEFAQQMINRSPIPVISYRPREVSSLVDFSL